MDDVDAKPNNFIAEATEELMEDDSSADVSHVNSTEEEPEGSENSSDNYIFDAEFAVNSDDDLRKVNPQDLSVEYITKFHFPDVGVAFMFYNWYASIQGFATRKCRVMRNSNGEITQQTFICNREGHRIDRRSNNEGRKWKPKSTIRCGCEARCQVHIEGRSERWYIKYFNDVHNHTFIENKWTGMLPVHRKMNEYDKHQMNIMKNVGIRTSNIYDYLGSQAGGFDKVNFLKREMYNEQVRQRQVHPSDAKPALDYLHGMGSEDDMFFLKHTVDTKGRLELLIWCDRISRRDYSVFGDVLAFDATYRKNRYLCPFVVFLGVNHHDQSIVFATAIVANETEKTYVWLLENFLEAMQGKAPVSVITDGVVAMRNSIKQVFPSAHHRLCAWHLLRNATSNVKNPKFVSRFRQCMLGDYDVEDFKCKWDSMVSDLGLQQNKWVLELYDRRRM